MYKYFLKTFYDKTNPKKYNLQIWQPNMHYTNIMAIKKIIILKTVRVKEKLLEYITDIILLAKVAKISSFFDFIQRYKWKISNTDLNITEELKLIIFK